MGKIIAYYALHYGKEYLAWSMRSVQEHVDEFHMLYTPVPSFGFQPDTPGIKNPDTIEELKRESERFRNKPIFWHTGAWRNEVEHRDAIMDIAKDRKADLIFVVDADEVWHPKELTMAIERISARKEFVTRVRWRHLWRSFDWYCDEQAMPVRFVRPGGSGEWYLSPQDYPMYHMGYAQGEAVQKYKMEIHGHKREIKKNWFETQFKPWSPQNNFNDVHPHLGNHQFNPSRVSEVDREAIKMLLGDHPYYNLEIIR